MNLRCLCILVLVGSHAIGLVSFVIGLIVRNAHTGPAVHIIATATDLYALLMGLYLQLVSSTREQRILITNDRDFGELVVKQRQPHTGVILFRLSTNQFTAKLARLTEVLNRYPTVLTDFLVITDDEPTRWRELTPRVLVLPIGIPEVFSPLLCALPISQLGYYLAKARGKSSYNFPSPEREQEHYQTLHESPFYDFSQREAVW